MGDSVQLPSNALIEKNSANVAKEVSHPQKQKKGKQQWSDLHQFDSSRMQELRFNYVEALFTSAVCYSI